MDKPNSPKLPTIGPTTLAGMMFHRASVNCNDQSLLYPFRGIVLDKLNNKGPVKRIENGEPILQVWREYHGHDFEQMASALDMPVQTYIDMESGEREVPFKVLKRLCREMKIHPFELYDYHDVVSPDFLMVLIDAYKNPASYNMHDGCMQEDVISALRDQSDENESYYGLHDLWVEIGQSAASKNQYKASIIDKLLANDGNPFFALMMSPSEYLQAQKENIRLKITMIEEAIDEIDSLVKLDSQEIRRAAYYFFGENTDNLIQKWFSYFEDHDNETDFHYCFMQDCMDYMEPDVMDASDSDLNNLFVGIRQNFEKSHIVLGLTLDAYQLTEDFDAIEDLEKQSGALLAAYDNRQVVLYHTPIAKPLGNPNDKNYFDMPLIQAGVKKKLSPRL